MTAFLEFLGKTFLGWVIWLIIFTILATLLLKATEVGRISDNFLGFILIILLLTFFWVPLWAYGSIKKKSQNKKIVIERKARKEKREKRKAYLFKEFEKHKTHLARNFNRTATPNEYEAFEEKTVEKWRNEIIRFLESIELPERHFKSQEHVEEAIEYINQLTQNYLYEVDNNSGHVEFSTITDPYVYELSCAKELEFSGRTAKALPIGADQGIDVRASKNGINVVLQCKLYSSAVGNKAVQEILAGQQFEKADIAAVVAPKGYTKSARELASSTGVLLLSHSDLKNLFAIITEHKILN